MCKFIHWEICKKLEFDHGKPNKPNIRPGEWHTQTPLDVEIQTNLSISARRPDLIIINKKKKRICRKELKESEKRDKYLDLARELKKKLLNMKVTIILIVIGALGTVTKGFTQGLEDLEIKGQVETVQTTALLRSSRILRRVLETWGDLLSRTLKA